MEFLGFVQVDEHLPANRRRFPQHESQALRRGITGEGLHPLYQRIHQKLALPGRLVVFHAGGRDGTADALSAQLSGGD